MKKTRVSCWILVIISIAILFTSGCSSVIAPANQLTAPKVNLDNTGKYMCPYRQDGSMADWSSQVIAKVLGVETGKLSGRISGRKSLGRTSNIVRKVGERAGEKLALETAGGMDGIRNSSDISSDSIDDLSVYMYVKYSDKDNYYKALGAMRNIYPEFKSGYTKALIKATSEQKKKQQ